MEKTIMTKAVSTLIASHVLAMAKAAYEGSEAPDGVFDALMTDYAERDARYVKLDLALPAGACIYLIVLMKTDGCTPDTVYIGQTLQAAGVMERVREHLKQCKTKADRAMAERAVSGSVVRVLMAPAPKKMLNRLERLGYRWLMENAYAVTVLNCAKPGANHCAEAVGASAKNPYRLRPLTSFGIPDARFPLERIRAELDAREAGLTSDALTSLRILGASGIALMEQAVVLRADGSAHIVTGGRYLLAARLAGRDHAIGDVVIMPEGAYAGGDRRAVMRACADIKARVTWRDARTKDELAAIDSAIKENYVTRCKRHAEENAAKGVKRKPDHYRRECELAITLVENAPQAYSSVRRFYNAVVIGGSAETVSESARD